MAVRLKNQVACKRCGRGMQTVAEIAPMGRSPGLVAFLCEDWGETHSTLIYPRDDHDQRGDLSPSSREVWSLTLDARSKFPSDL
jgi:hypothetical protein